MAHKMGVEMICDSCGGIIDTKKRVPIYEGCFLSRFGNPCTKCNLVHDEKDFSEVVIRRIKFYHVEKRVVNG